MSIDFALFLVITIIQILIIILLHEKLANVRYARIWRWNTSVAAAKQHYEFLTDFLWL